MRGGHAPSSRIQYRPSPSVAGGGSVISFPLASDPYTARMSLQAIFPRPDSDGDVNSWERHKLQPSGIPLRFPISVQGGVRPFQYSVSGPSGMTIGTDLYTDWATNRFQDYGVLKWANPTVGTHSVTVTVTDQTGSTVSIAWDLVVVDKDDTSKFMWFDATNGNDSTGAGTWTNPYKTDLSKAFGSSSASTTIQGHCILKAGTYDIPVHASSQCVVDNTKRPVVCYAMPTSTTAAASVTINGTAELNGQSGSAYSALFFGDLTMSGGVSSVANWRFFNLGSGGGKRITFWKLSFPNPEGGTSKDDGCTSIYFNSGATSSSSSYDQYIALVSCTETGRPSGSASYSLLAAYGLKDGVVEDCYITGGSAVECVYLKDSCQNFTVAMNYVDTTSGRGLSSGDQNQNGGTSANMEWVFNRSRANSGGSAALTWNHAVNATNVGSHWSARNTFIGDVDIREDSTSGVGPYVLENDVVQTSWTPPVTTGTRITNTGTELQGSGTYVDSSFNLTGSSLSYKGSRGYEIQ